jgi:hypothetical protein
MREHVCLSVLARARVHSCVSGLSAPAPSRAWRSGRSASRSATGRRANGCGWAACMRCDALHGISRSCRAPSRRYFFSLSEISPTAYRCSAGLSCRPHLLCTACRVHALWHAAQPRRQIPVIIRHCSCALPCLCARLKLKLATAVLGLVAHELLWCGDRQRDLSALIGLYRTLVSAVAIALHAPNEAAARQSVLLSRRSTRSGHHLRANQRGHVPCTHAHARANARASCALMRAHGGRDCRSIFGCAGARARRGACARTRPG